jgi:hypothetical protein
MEDTGGRLKAANGAGEKCRTEDTEDTEEEN